MEKTLKVYKDGEVVGTKTAEQTGKTTISISGLTADTTYPKGTYKVAYSNESGESEKVDVPEFKTSPHSEL
ncbi:hypothetical protein qdsa001_166 [Staphylococcus phage qdsa001]|nr:hypothetical protein qdsa001_166 [Staphylococcus phage qdsa001]QXV86181.1 hypothetical protein [Staphylococcus phage SAPYZU_15]QYC52133.1 hypothetical protein RP15_gp080 [Staphylococcus phage vB_Sau-RP15]UVD42349.1 hypothetical protein [Staphylococcus phage vB_SauM-V1SA19]UVD42772.1 hypothetical protein [Staphylococcus phage vB_SauM-V1SA22]UXE02904.1 major tail protein [Staphylococcus phage Koomba-kaat_1]WAW12017.1 major tail protein [Staphylococcus phage StAP1]WAW12232.1 major tail prote